LADLRHGRWPRLSRSLSAEPPQPPAVGVISSSLASASSPALSARSRSWSAWPPPHRR
jgi:hypothetical protein